MTFYAHLSGNSGWMAALLLPVGLGVYAIVRPHRMADSEARYWRRRFGIRAGPVGPGTLLYYRMVGVWFLIMAGMIVWGQLRP